MSLLTKKKTFLLFKYPHNPEESKFSVERKLFRSEIIIQNTILEFRSQIICCVKNAIPVLVQLLLEYKSSGQVICCGALVLCFLLLTQQWSFLYFISVFYFCAQQGSMKRCDKCNYTVVDG